MDYYHNLITEKSWKELQNLRRRVDFVLIGGWATYIYSKTLKSKDIDIIVDFDKLDALRKNYDVTKNDRLKKYEARRDEVEIDIYLPYYSKIGIPVEDLLKNTLNLEGFVVVEINYLVVLKIFTLNQRENTTKGRKDFIDIMSLLLTNSCSHRVINRLIVKYKLQSSMAGFKKRLEQTRDLPELKLNKHAYSRLKRGQFSFAGGEDAEEIEADERPGQKQHGGAGTVGGNDGGED